MRWFTLLVWIMVFQAVGALLGLATRQDLHYWYHQLTQAPLTPPDVVFPVVWSVLYVMIAIAGWCYWQQRTQPNATPTLLFYSAQVILNWAWTPVFFYAHLTLLAFICLLLIIVMTALTISFGWRISKCGTLLLVPYWFWLCFAAYLNGYIVWHN